jgi:AcrR family transcriptional regulator
MNKELVRQSPIAAPKSNRRKVPGIPQLKGKTNQYERILSISESLMSQKGYKGVSFQQIADKVGLHKSSLFHYFDNKEELLLRILERPFNEFYADFQKIMRDKELRSDEKLKKAINSHLSLLMDYEDNVRIFLNELKNLSGKNRRIHLMKIREYEEGFQEIVEGMKKEGFFKGLDPKIVTYGILGMINWVTRWFRRDGPLAIGEISDIFYRMLTSNKRLG